MQGPSTAERIMTSIAYASPTLLVFMVGMIIAMFMIAKYPKVSILALVGFLILALATVAGISLSQYFLGRVIHGSLSRERYESMSRIVSIGTALFRSLGYVFLVLAIFLGRTSKPTEPAFAPPTDE